MTALAFSSTLAAESKETSAAFVTDGHALADLRYRYEHVAQAGFANDPDAHTLRARLGLQSAKVWHIQALIEVEGITHLNGDFNDTVNGNVSFPVVADPDGFQLNRLQLE